MRDGNDWKGTERRNTKRKEEETGKLKEVERGKREKEMKRKRESKHLCVISAISVVMMQFISTHMKKQLITYFLRLICNIFAWSQMLQFVRMRYDFIQFIKMPLKMHELLLEPVEIYSEGKLSLFPDVLLVCSFLSLYPLWVFRKFHVVYEDFVCKSIIVNNNRKKKTT